MQPYKAQVRVKKIFGIWWAIVVVDESVSKNDKKANKLLLGYEIRVFDFQV